MPTCTRRIGTAGIIVLASLTGACADTNRLAGPDVPRQPAFSASIAAATAWTASGPGTVTVVSDGTAGDAVMSYLLTGNYDEQVWSFTTTATQAGTVTLPWTESGDHSRGGITVYAIVNGENVAQVAFDGETFGSFTYSGTYTFTVNAGDTYGFSVGGFPLNGDLLSGTFTVDLPEGPVNPVTKDDCTDGGWATYGFRNQGQCIAFVETGHDSR